MNNWICRILSLTIPILVGSCLYAETKEIKPTQQWKGSVTDLDLGKLAPESLYIDDAKSFTKIWDKWETGKKERPKIDFGKELVIVVTTRGSSCSTTTRLSDNGNLSIDAITTLDFGEGFRYQILVIPAKGIKSINGKEYKKRKEID